MAETTYSYTISTGTANGAVSPSFLAGEIRKSAIVTALDRIDASVSGDSLDVVMKDALSAGDVTILNGIVVAHEGKGDDAILLYIDEVNAPVSVNASGSGFGVVYTAPSDTWQINEVAFRVNVNEIRVQIEIDGTSVLPSPDGLLLKDLASMELSKSTQVKGFLIQYDRLRWIWSPRVPAAVHTSFKILMRSNDTNATRKVEQMFVERCA